MRLLWCDSGKVKSESGEFRHQSSRPWIAIPKLMKSVYYFTSFEYTNQLLGNLFHIFQVTRPQNDIFASNPLS